MGGFGSFGFFVDFFWGFELFCWFYAAFRGRWGIDSESFELFEAWRLNPLLWGGFVCEGRGRGEIFKGSKGTGAVRGVGVVRGAGIVRGAGAPMLAEEAVGPEEGLLFVLDEHAAAR